MKDNWLNTNIKPILALIIVVVGFAYFYMCSIRDIKPDPQILIAFVSTISLVTGYFYGSSSGQAKKEDAGTPPTTNVTGEKPNVTINPTPPTE